ncbi:MAG: hypothetical protein ABIH23_27485 [bacterium]
MSGSPHRDYRGVVLPEQPSIEQIRQVVPDYEAMIESVMTVIVDRYECNPEYGWLDTKINLTSGQDFPREDRPRGPDTVYGWIQGRGLEALVGHARWFRKYLKGQDRASLVSPLDRIIGELLDRLRRTRERNSGHLFFFMTPDGDPFKLDEAGAVHPVTLTQRSAHNFSDLFCAKGMYAAARYLEELDALDDAREYCRRVDNAIWQGRFVTDQQSFDLGRPIEIMPERRFHGPFMIEIGTAALLAEYEKDSESVDFGLKLIRYVLDYHTNLNGRWSELRKYDFFEFIDADNRPYRQGDQIVSDPGHALEFVGLSLEFTEIVKRLDSTNPAQKKEIDKIEQVMPLLLLRNYGNGFQDVVGGIWKSVDLITRQPINSDMPWWSLPETIRAALECWHVADPRMQQDCLNIVRACHNAFVAHYVRPELNLMAVQTRDANGNVADVIPATSDADPGYHTGLCLIDCLEILR